MRVATHCTCESHSTFAINKYTKFKRSGRSWLPCTPLPLVPSGSATGKGSRVLCFRAIRSPRRSNSKPKVNWLFHAAKLLLLYYTVSVSCPFSCRCRFLSVSYLTFCSNDYFLRHFFWKSDVQSAANMIHRFCWQHFCSV